MHLCTPTVDQLISLNRIDDPRIGPDGRHVAYTVTQADWVQDEYVTQIWLADAGASRNVQLTRGHGSSLKPRWSPDGQSLAFLRKCGESQQIYLISPFGGEARQLTQSETDVQHLAWSPDGKCIAYTAPDAESEVLRARRARYGDFEAVDQDYSMSHLWTVDVQSGESTRQTCGCDFTVGRVAWSPDGRCIAFDARRTPNAEETDSHIYVLDCAEGSVRRAVDLAGRNANPEWSPDGAYIVFETQMGDPTFYRNVHLGVVSASGGPVRDVTPDFDEKTWTPIWRPQGIMFYAWQRTAAHIFRVESAIGEVSRITEPDDSFVGATFSLSAGGHKVAFTAGDAWHYPEVYISTVEPFAPRRLTDWGAQLDDFTLSSREVIRWPSLDGTEIEGVLVRPPDFDASRRYPLLVVVHGGPAAVSRPWCLGYEDSRLYPIELWAAKAALILMPNYRGSGGYGQAFRALNVRNLGVGDRWDVESGVDFLVQQGLVDADRVGIMGWSQGGYISAFIATCSDRFRAASVGAGVSDWVTYYVNTDIHPFTRHYLQATPWEDMEIYRKTSPISYIDTAHTPTLIQHGEKDERVPIPNAFELYQGLRDRGVLCRLIVYKGFKHSIDKPKATRAVMEHNLAWFNHWLWGEELADDWPGEFRPETC